MPSPHELLRALSVELDPILADTGAFNPQQLTFLQHVRKTTDAQRVIIEPMPQSAYALQRLIPLQGDRLLQQQAALFGYARLLLESPDSFEGASFPAAYTPRLERIYLYGQQLYQLIETIQQNAVSARHTQQTAPATTLNLAQLIADELPVLQYLLRDEAINLTAHVDSVTVCASRYHLVALIQHIIVTLATELVEYGHIKLGADTTALYIFCTGIQLTSDDINSLFKKQGRYIYPQRLQQDGGKISFLRERGRGASIVLHFASE